MTLQGVLEKILHSRFEPVETLLALKSFITGLILLLPANQNLMILSDNPELKVMFAIYLATVGLVHLIALALSSPDRPRFTYRKYGLMGLVSGNIFLAMATVMYRGFVGRLEWTTYIVVALIACIVFVNIVYRSLDRGG